MLNTKVTVRINSTMRVPVIVSYQGPDRAIYHKHWIDKRRNTGRRIPHWDCISARLAQDFFVATTVNRKPKIA